MRFPDSEEMAMRRLLVLLILADVVFLANCGGGGTTSSSTTSGQVTLSSIQVDPSTVSIAQGTTQAFKAMGAYSDGSTKDLTLAVQWSCLLPNVATVSNTAPTKGLAAAVAPGTALITASLGAVSNNAALTVKGGLSVTSFVVNPATATIGFGNQLQFAAIATFSDMTQQDVTNVSSWSSSSSFVTSNSGLAIGSIMGMSTVSAVFSGGGNGSATLAVDLSNLLSISLLPSSASIAKGTEIQFAAIGTFKDGSTRDVSSLVASSGFWSSSNLPVAAFKTSVSGLAAGIRAGTTTITATITSPTGSSFSASTILNVTSAQLQSVVVVPFNPSIASTTKLDLTAIGIFSDSSTQDLTTLVSWASFNPLVASVATREGKVTGVSAGSTMISATSPAVLGGIRGVSSIKVTSATLASITVMPANVFTSPGNTVAYTALGSFSDGSNQNVSAIASLSSDETGVASTASSVATAEGVGQATLMETLGSIRGVTTLSVASPQQISIAITPGSAQLAQQTSTQLKATGTLDSGGTQDLTTAVCWTSSSPKVATVGWQTGILTGVAPGQSTITASLGSVSETIQGKVTNASLTSITLSPPNPTLSLGASQSFTATGHFADGSSETLLGPTWTSSDPAVAVVDSSSGFLSSTGTGVATITATANGVSGSTNVTVQ